MSEISILDLQNLRHLIGGYDTTHCKMQDYASQAQDLEVKKLFQIAREKSYYVPAEKASQQEISHVKSVLSGLAMK